MYLLVSIPLAGVLMLVLVGAMYLRYRQHRRVRASIDALLESQRALGETVDSFEREFARPRGTGLAVVPAGPRAVVRAFGSHESVGVGGLGYFTVDSHERELAQTGGTGVGGSSGRFGPGGRVFVSHVQSGVSRNRYSGAGVRAGGVMAEWYPGEVENRDELEPMVELGELVVLGPGPFYRRAALHQGLSSDYRLPRGMREAVPVPYERSEVE